MKILLTVFFVVLGIGVFADDASMVKVLSDKLIQSNERYERLLTKYKALKKKYKSLKKSQKESGVNNRQRSQAKVYKSKKSSEYRGLKISYDAVKKSISELERRMRIAQRNEYRRNKGVYRVTRHKTSGEVLRSNKRRKNMEELQKLRRRLYEIQNKMREYR